MSRRRQRKKKKKAKQKSKGMFSFDDERYTKIASMFFLLLGISLGLAFISYLFTWQSDQDKVLHFDWQAFISADVKVENWLGRFGAFLSSYFIYWGFGVSSLLVVYMSFFLSVNLWKKAAWKSILKTLSFTVLVMVFFSVFFSFIFRDSAFPWGGAFGDAMVLWLSNFMGEIGLFLLLVGLTAAYFIWLFNPSLDEAQTNVNWQFFKWPRWKPVTSTPPVQDPEAVTSDTGKGQKSDDETEEEEDKKEEKNEKPSSSRPTFGKDDFYDKSELEDQDKEEDQGSSFPASGSKDKSSTKTNTSDGPSSTTETIDEMEVRVGDSQRREESLEVERSDDEVTEEFDPTMDLSNYEFPDLDILDMHSDEKLHIDRDELEENKNQIIETLKNYKIEITKIRATIGPTVTLYEIVPAPGVRISKIKNLEDDIALSLSALGIRIIAPIPGKGTIGIEVPNKRKQIVSLKEVLKSKKFREANMDIPIALGRTIANEVFVADLAKMPHLLIAGATGQGKSVGINSILMSILFRKHPSQVKLVLIDPKKVELFPYSKLDDHFLAFLPDQEEPIVTETKKVIHTLTSLCKEMDERYDLLKKARARNIREYNKKFVNRKLNPEKGHRFMPLIVLVIDEFADLIMTAGKDVEMPIARLAQLARAVGIHLVIATQRPSVNIITGVIKANFPARIAYKVTSKVDSRTILDSGGAEQLIGRGDMLLSVNGNIVRLQGAFVDTPEVEDVIDSIHEQQGFPQPYFLPDYEDEEQVIDDSGITLGELDENFEDAARLIIQSQHGSTSMLQRRLHLGYNRAGRIIDQLEAFDIVGPHEGSKAREVLVDDEEELDEILEEIRKVTSSSSG